LKASAWLQVNVKAKSAFNNKLFALNVVISIPVPDNTAKADIQTTQGMLQPQQLACLQHEAQQVLFGIQKCSFSSVDLHTETPGDYQAFLI
jgi:hypothetical protein